VILVVVLLALLSASQEQQTPCNDLAACRAMAESALAAKDYERLHDLAWAAYRKGKSNDPELMLLLARAQSLSGRPLDALVMLERLAARGIATDAATSEDFARVRALSRWPEVAEKVTAASTSALPATAARAPAPSPKEPAPPAKEPAPPAKEPASSAKTPAPSAKAPAPSTKAPVPPAKAPAPSAKAPLSFTTLLTPTAVAYDTVSQRFLIADRKAKRIAVVDANTGQVATLVGAQGALGEIGGMAIDPRQGDLWVVSATDDGSKLHKLQLISGRILSTVPLSIEHPVTAMAYARGAGLIVADTNGVVWRLNPDGGAAKLAALEYVPRGLAADGNGRLYVAGGSARLARFTVGPALRKIDTIDVDASIPADAPFVVSGNRLNFVVPADGGFVIQPVALK
jgi:sugar lactone lactonase YvrE